MAHMAGSSVIAVEKGLRTDRLRTDDGVVTVYTPTELETAVQSDSTKTIFVPRNTFGPSLLKRILQRNSLVKTIFWEE